MIHDRVADLKRLPHRDLARELKGTSQRNVEEALIYHINMEEQPLIVYKGVNINQQELGVLNDVNFELKKGEFVYLIGKVGSGKSTFLKTIYGELDICGGEAYVLGYDTRTIKQREIAALRRKLGIVFQDFQLLTDRTVHDNLDFVLRASRLETKG